MKSSRKPLLYLMKAPMLGDAWVLPHLIEAVARVVPLRRVLAAV